MSVLNLGDPEFELIDPTPNVHALFLQFDQTFFWAKLSSRAVVRWSKRMYSCAGICSYDRGGLCDIALSEPLLKLRPRKDLVETLLHEMIHAFLFITCRDQDRDGHGPNFKEHMFRINKAAGLNISIYHDFHDEVKLYQTHWWRCDGPCQALRPHFGIVRRTANRAPGPSEYWWKDHQRKCGGTFIKIKEPEPKLKGKKENKINNGDITKFITKGNNKKDKPVLTVSKPVLKDSNVNKKKWSDSNLVVSKTNNIVFNPKLSKPVLKDNHIDKKQQTSDVVMTVRNVWANKTLAPSINTSNVNQNTKKRHSSDLVNRKPIPVKSPPKKIMKIDDYFNKTASNLLKDIYGQEFNITQSEKDSKLIPVLVQNNLVNCPICDVKINSDKINNHLDECLNKDVIEILSQNNQDNVICNSEIENKHDTEVIDLTNIQFEMPKNEIPATAEESKMNVETKDGFDDMEYFEDVILDEKILSGSSKVGYNCPCCGKVTQSIEEHLDECLAFDNTTIPEEGTSTSTTDTDEVDIHDETLTLNATGTMSPCPCCMKMVEMADMNDHLDNCFGSSFSKNFDDS